MKRLLFLFLLLVSFVVESLWSEAHSQIRETGQPQCQSNFDIMDTNKDGVVSKEEFMSFDHKGRNAEAVFKARDLDGDGKLTIDEFCSGRGKGRRQ